MKKISGYLVSRAGLFYGPFETASEAAEWHVRLFPDWQAPWHIVPIFDPRSEGDGDVRVVRVA